MKSEYLGWLFALCAACVTTERRVAPPARVRAVRGPSDPLRDGHGAAPARRLGRRHRSLSYVGAE